MNRRQEKFEAFADRIKKETLTDYDETRATEAGKITGKEELPKSNATINESYESLIKCDIMPGKIRKRYIKKLEKLLENLSTKPELYTALMNDIFKNVYEFKKILFKENNYSLKGKKRGSLYKFIFTR